MEIMINKEESDGRKTNKKGDSSEKKKEYRTIDTQTDFGPFSAFPPQPGNTSQSWPPKRENMTLPLERNGFAHHITAQQDNDTGKPLSPREEYFMRSLPRKKRDSMVSSPTDTVDGVTPLLARDRESLYSEDCELLRNSLLGKTLWFREETEDSKW